MKMDLISPYKPPRDKGRHKKNRAKPGISPDDMSPRTRAETTQGEDGKLSTCNLTQQRSKFNIFPLAENPPKEASGALPGRVENRLV
jgi:hypothetical protein